LPSNYNISEERQLPVKLERDLILDSVVEIRFVSTIAEDIVTPRLFEAIYKDFPHSKDVNVPPTGMRAMEPFKYAVTTSLHNNEFSIGFASNSIVFNCVNGYKGWDKFFELIKTYLYRFFSIGIFSEILRIGVRYVNVFENTSDLSKHILLEINFNNIKEYTSLHTTLNLQLKKKDCQFNLGIADTALVNGIPGSLLDIDVIKADPGPTNFENICSHIEQMHQEEKKLFINILHPEFLKTLGPTY
jgi:uncharacterized protein (TIGR04255 family)